mmetsp:Transcript_47520/g.70742  ORF Transcript_47520/g.70742 Transcript_47520/m.70742 type:complete len:444 (-) Transcript_47520:45-1376(-)
MGREGMERPAEGVGDSENDGENTRVPTDSGILVEKSGWYGFCFNGKGTTGSNDDTRSGPGQGARDLTIQSTECSSETKISLPLRNAGEDIVSPEYGLILYFPANAHITVTPPPSIKNEDQQAVDWELVNSRLEENKLYSPGQPTPNKKKIVCRKCRKCFASVISVELHIKSVHLSRDPESIWHRPLRVEYIDEDVAVIQKPQGMSVMGEERGVNTLCRSDLLMQVAYDGRKPRPAHRLDAATGGLLVVARSKIAERGLSMAFAERTVSKRYRALVVGRWEGNSSNDRDHADVISHPVQKKPSESKFRIVGHYRSPYTRDGWVTKVDLWPVTGRKHQLRKHCQVMGHPIWGDTRYGGTAMSGEICNRPAKNGTSTKDKVDDLLATKVHENPLARLCLWAVEVSFPHPRTGETVEVVMPNDPGWLRDLVKHQEVILATRRKSSFC